MQVFPGECPVCRKPGIERKSLSVLPGAARFPKSLLARASSGGGDGATVSKGAPAHSTKMRELMKLLREDMAGGRRSVVFSQWTSFLDLIGSAAEAEEIPWKRLDGSLSREARMDCVNWLKDETGGGRVLLISLKAGGTGLNLVAATRLYLMDLWWNPAVEEQAIQRVHRIGQTEEVHIYKFVISDSMDVGILDLQRAKEHLIEDAIWGSDSGEGCKKLTFDDLRRLFNPCKTSLRGGAAQLPEAPVQLPPAEPALAEVLLAQVPPSLAPVVSGEKRGSVALIGLEGASSEPPRSPAKLVRTDRPSAFEVMAGKKEAVATPGTSGAALVLAARRPPSPRRSTRAVAAASAGYMRDRPSGLPQPAPGFLAPRPAAIPTAVVAEPPVDDDQLELELELLRDQDLQMSRGPSASGPFGAPLSGAASPPGERTARANSEERAQGAASIISPVPPLPIAPLWEAGGELLDVGAVDEPHVAKVAIEHTKERHRKAASPLQAATPFGTASLLPKDSGLSLTAPDWEAAGACFMDDISDMGGVRGGTRDAAMSDDSDISDSDLLAACNALEAETEGPL